MKAKFSTWDLEIRCMCIENVHPEGHQLLSVKLSYGSRAPGWACGGLGAVVSVQELEIGTHSAVLQHVPLCCMYHEGGWLNCSCIYIFLCTQKGAQMNAILLKI